MLFLPQKPAKTVSEISKINFYFVTGFYLFVRYLHGKTEY